jgi:hypothetical protein
MTDMFHQWMSQRSCSYYSNGCNPVIGHARSACVYALENRIIDTLVVICSSTILHLQNYAAVVTGNQVDNAIEGKTEQHNYAAYLGFDIALQG